MKTGNKWVRRAVVAVCGVALAAGWQVYGRLIVPLKGQAMEAHRDAADVKGRIVGAQKTIAEIRALEQDAGGANGGLQSLEGDIPSGSPLVWLPARMEKHFGNMGLPGAVIRLNTKLEESELPGFERTYWIVQLPVGSSPGEFRKACLAVTEIERADSSVRVLDAEIRNDANDSSRRLMVMNVSVLARKVDALR